MIRVTKLRNRHFDPILKSIYYEIRDGNQLTLINCVQYPRTFNFALKLKADLDQVLYNVITDKKIKRVKKISLIEGLKRNSALTLSCGSDLPPAPILCIELKQNYLFKYFTDLEGIEEGNHMIIRIGQLIVMFQLWIWTANVYWRFYAGNVRTQSIFGISMLNNINQC